MVIENIYVDSFGAIKDKTITFGDKVNIIQGCNESGKSTVFAFIKFMFYGVTRNGGERARYMNWNESVMGGTLTFRCEEGHFRIERRIAVSGGEKESARECVKVVDLESNQQCLKGENVGEHFFGVPESVFVQTALLGQLSDGNVDGKSLSEAIENILFSADETVNTKKALAKLEKMRKQYVHKKGDGGIVADMKKYVDDLEIRLSNAKHNNSEIIVLEEDIAKYEENLKNESANLSKITRQSDCYAAWSVLNDFKKLHSMEDNLRALDEDIAELKEKCGSNGRIPSQAEISEMKLLRKDLLACEDEERVLSSAIEALEKKMSETLCVLDKGREVDGAGGSKRLIAKAKSLAKAAKRACVLGICSIGATVMAAVIGVLLRGQYIYYGIAGALIFSVCAVFAFCISAKKKKTLYNLAGKFVSVDGKSCSDAELIDALNVSLSDFESERDEVSANQTELVRLNGQAEAKRATLEAKRSQLSLKLSEWVLVSHGDCDDAVIKYCEDLYCKAKNLDDERTGLKMSLENKMHELVGQDEKEVEAQLDGVDLSEFEKINPKDLQNARNFISQKISSIRDRLNEKSVHLAVLKNQNDDPVEISAELEKNKRDLEQAEKKGEACQLAYDAIESASQQLRQKVAPQLSSAVEKMTERLTSGRYSQIEIDPSINVSYGSLAATHSTDYMSVGTKTSVYIALRLALIRLLYRKTLPPMAFDESLAHLDNERAENLLKLLCEQGDGGMQILIFTCHTREAELAGTVGDYNAIILD